MAIELSGVRIAGERVRQLRKESGDNLVTFAPKCGISVQYLSLIEIGRRTSVSPRVFNQICDALGVNRDELIAAETEQAAAVGE